MNGLFGGWLSVLIQLVDFLFKGVNFYLATEQGQKEFDDVVQAWESRANTDDNSGTVDFTASNADGSVSKGSPQPPDFGAKPGYASGKPNS